MMQTIKLIHSDESIFLYRYPEYTIPLSNMTLLPYETHGIIYNIEDNYEYLYEHLGRLGWNRISENDNQIHMTNWKTPIPTSVETFWESLYKSMLNEERGYLLNYEKDITNYYNLKEWMNVHTIEDVGKKWIRFDEEYWNLLLTPENGEHNDE